MENVLPFLIINRTFVAMRKINFRRVSLNFFLMLFVCLYGTVSAQEKPIRVTTSPHAITYFYTPHLLKSVDAANQVLASVFNHRFSNTQYVPVHDWKRSGLTHVLNIKKTLVFNDRLEFLLKSGEKRTLYFSKLFGNKEILFAKSEIDHLVAPSFTERMVYDKSYYFITPSRKKMLDDSLSIFADLTQEGKLNRKAFNYDGTHRLFIDAFYTIQQNMGWQNREKQLQAFKTVAAKYRAMKVKPVMSEKQRKEVVLANLMTRQRKYKEAIQFYRKVIALDSVSYPAAYNNLALLNAQLKQYKWAIYYMRKFILLEPDTKDARAAKDKIYEWNYELHQKN